MIAKLSVAVNCHLRYLTFNTSPEITNAEEKQNSSQMCGQLCSIRREVNYLIIVHND